MLDSRIDFPHCLTPYCFALVPCITALATQAAATEPTPTAAPGCIFVAAGDLTRLLETQLREELGPGQLCDTVNNADVVVSLHAEISQLRVEIFDHQEQRLAWRNVPIREGLNPAVRVVTLLVVETLEQMASPAPRPPPAPLPTKRPSGPSAAPPTAPGPGAQPKRLELRLAITALSWRRPFLPPQAGAGLGVCVHWRQFCWGARAEMGGLLGPDRSTATISATAREASFWLDIGLDLKAGPSWRWGGQLGVGFNYLWVRAKSKAYSGEVPSFSANQPQIRLQLAVRLQYAIWDNLWLGLSAGAEGRMGRLTVSLPPAYEDTAVDTGWLLPRADLSLGWRFF